MGKNSLEDILSNKLDKRNPNLDYDALWGELEPRLPKQKKRPTGLFLMFFSFVMIGLIGYGLYDYNQGIENTSASSVVAKSKNIATNDIATVDQITATNVIAKPIAVDKVTAEATASDINNSTSLDHQPSTSIVSTKTNDNKKSTHNKSTQVTNEDISFVNDSQLLETGRPNTDFSLASQSEQSSQTSSQPRSTYIAPQTSEQTDDFPNNETKSLHEASQNIQQTAAPELPVLKLTEASLIKLLKASTIPSLPLSGPTLLPRSFFTPTIAQTNNEAKQDRKKIGTTSIFHFSVGALAGVDAYSQDESITNSYESILQEPLSSLFGYQASLGYKLQLDNGFHVGIDGSVDRLIQKFELNNEISITSDIYNEEAFTHNGLFIGANQRGQIVTSQDVLKYNTYTFIDIIPNIGYTLSGKIPFSFSAGPIININQSFDGKVVDPFNIILQNTDDLYSRSASLQGLFLSAGINKSLNSNLSLQAGLNFKWRKGVTSDTNTLFDQNQNTLGVSLGLGYRL